MIMLSLVLGILIYLYTNNLWAAFLMFLGSEIALYIFRNDEKPW